MLAAGAFPRTVMKTLGHSQIGLTMNTYTHVLPTSNGGCRCSGGYDLRLSATGRWLHHMAALVNRP